MLGLTAISRSNLTKISMKIFNKFRQLLICALAACLPTAVATASITEYAIDPNARAILNQMQSAYSSLNSLSEQIVAEEPPELPHHLIVHTSLKMMRPYYVVMTSDSQSSRTGASSVTVDGSNCYVTAPQYPTRYLKFPVPTETEAFHDAVASGIMSSMTLALFNDAATVKNLFSPAQLATLQCAHPVKLDGLPVNIVVLTDRNGVTLTLEIGKKDHLLRRITATQPDKPGTFVETYTSVLPNAALTASNFTFVSPPHMDAYNAGSFDQAQQYVAGSQQQ
jgi:outer membrane lipoprotein-sorting protein